MKCLVILAAFMCLGAGAQASTGPAKDCTPALRSHVRVRLTLNAEGLALSESAIKNVVTRTWNPKGLRIEWVPVDPAKRPSEDVDLWVDLGKNAIITAIATSTNKLAREYSIQPISAYHLLFAERKGAVEGILGETVADEIRKFVSSAQCEQGR